MFNIIGFSKKKEKTAFYLILILLGLCFITSCCSDEEKALVYAVQNGDLTTIDKYLKGGGDPNFSCWTPGGSRAGSDMSLLQSAVYSDSMVMLKRIISCKRTTQQSLDEMLDWAILHNDLKKARYLIHHKAKFDRKRSRLYYSHYCFGDDKEYTALNKFIKNEGGDLSIFVEDYDSPYYCTVFETMVASVQDPPLTPQETIRRLKRNIKHLKKRGVNIKEKTSENSFFPKHGLSLEVSELKLILKAGADPNQKDLEGKNALMYFLNESGTLCNHRSKQIGMLIQSGLRTDATDNNGKTIFDYAATYPECKKVLSRYIK